MRLGHQEQYHIINSTSDENLIHTIWLLCFPVHVLIFQMFLVSTSSSSVSKQCGCVISWVGSGHETSVSYARKWVELLWSRDKIADQAKTDFSEQSEKDLEW